MKRKVDFTVKGTKLPAIPTGTGYKTVYKGIDSDCIYVDDITYGFDFRREAIINLCSFGGFGRKYIVANFKDTQDENHFVFPLSTIERLAEEQGMLWVEETERNWTGIRFRWEDESVIYTLVKKRGVYHYGDGYNNTQKEVDSYFLKGTWIEVKEEPFTPMLTPENDNSNGGRFIPHPTPSIKQYIDKLHSLEYNIRNGFSLFAGVDDNYRLQLIKDAQKHLAKTVAELNFILNPPKMRSCVELAEDMAK